MTLNPVLGAELMTLTAQRSEGTSRGRTGAADAPTGATA